MAQLDKPIIHLQIPLSLKYDEGFRISLEGVEYFKGVVRQELGDKAYILATPFDIKTIGIEGENVELEPKTLEAFLKQLGYKDGVKND